MTPEAQRIAIAEACGWKQRKDSTMPSEKYWSGLEDAGFLPNYTGDLNAMHEAEKALDASSLEVKKRWLDTMAVVCAWPETALIMSNSVELNYRIGRATAAQRAEAFLRTLTLWDDSK